ncbi:hypothetical protein Q4E93_22050 [Flavitalea sp. BT771]|uniref:MauE/DoxX family redox-associated membrane protein n=1 Tax=Flavitalea sp. BT771 TaxID=3063329 RepID=UPI0026E26773|nr:MauE/DoxX family redox-associated membrane protein [Flavitalea sp. BT771]MDO6433310.1 hypothetical protein [Flavitalea sp. BT771]MDV6222785.1 hypothetical protein [Flavitalea sp. BT771]
MRKKQIILEIAGGLIILLFTYASLSKLLAFRHFIQALNNQPLPKAWTLPLAYGILTAEITTIMMLVIPSSRKWGFVLATLVMLMFTSYTSIILLHTFSYIPCSCGGVVELLSWKQHLVLNVLFLAVSILGSRLSFQEQ